MQDDAEAVVVQLDMGPVVGLAAFAQGGKAGAYGVGQTEEIDRQIDQVGAQIEPQTGAGTGIFAPTFAHDGTIAIHVALEVGDLAELAGFEDGLGGGQFRSPSGGCERPRAADRAVWRWRRGRGPRRA